MRPFRAESRSRPPRTTESRAMTMTYKELRELPIDELDAQYDRTAPEVSVGLGFIRDELARRESERKETQRPRREEDLQELPD